MYMREDLAQPTENCDTQKGEVLEYLEFLNLYSISRNLRTGLKFISY